MAMLQCSQTQINVKMVVGTTERGIWRTATWRSSKGFAVSDASNTMSQPQTLLQAAPKGIHCKLNDGRPEAMAKRSMVRNANMKKGLPVWWSMRSTPQTRRASFHGAAGVRTGQSHSWRHEVPLASPMGAPVFEKKGCISFAECSLVQKHSMPA